MDYYAVYYDIHRVYICSDRSVFYCHVHSIGDDDVMKEETIAFMFIMGCGTALALFGMYIAYKMETRD